MPNFFQRPELTQRPSPEPPGFDLLRDMLMRRAFALNANPYGMSPGGQSNVGMMYPNRNFDPYGGWFGGGGDQQRGYGDGFGGGGYHIPEDPRFGGGGWGGGGGMQMGRGRRRMPWAMGPPARNNPMPGYFPPGGDMTQGLLQALQTISKGPKSKSIAPPMGGVPEIQGRPGGVRTMPMLPRKGGEYFAPPGGRPPGQMNPFGGAAGMAKSMNPWTYDGEQVDYDAAPWTPNFGPGVEPFAYGVSGAGGGFQWSPGGGQQPAGSQTLSMMSGIGSRPPGPGVGTGRGAGAPGGGIGTSPWAPPRQPPGQPPPLGKVPRNPVGPRYGIGGR